MVRAADGCSLAAGSPSRLSLEEICRSGEAQIRPLDEDNVERLCDVLRDGGTFLEPPRVWHDGEKYWLSYGWHRVEAYQRSGESEIDVEVLEGTLDDARDDACRPHNATHGKPETAEERRARVRAYIERHPELSQRRIAQWCGVTQPTIHKYRQELSGDKSLSPDASAPHQTEGRVIGRDGKNYPAKRSSDSDDGHPGETDGSAPTNDSDSTKPHVANNSGDNEWYTPEDFIKRAVAVMGGIDLDPASSDEANRVVGAKHYFTAEDDGLGRVWEGRVWMNPPYGQPLIQQFCETLVDHHRAGRVTQAIVLVNNATETRWFQELLDWASAFCLPAGRVRFWKPGEKAGAPLQGQAVIYLGDHPEEFARRFEDLGKVCHVKR